jgi:hypothetical protein
MQLERTWYPSNQAQWKPVAAAARQPFLPSRDGGQCDTVVTKSTLIVRSKGGRYVVSDDPLETASRQHTKHTLFNNITSAKNIKVVTSFGSSHEQVW